MAPPTLRLTFEETAPSAPLPLQIDLSATSSPLEQPFPRISDQWTLILPPAPVVPPVPFPPFPQRELVIPPAGSEEPRSLSYSLVPAEHSSAPLDEAALAQSVQNIQASLSPPTPGDRLLSHGSLAGEVLKDIPLVGVVASAASQGKTLADRAQQVERNIQAGKDPVEEVVCTVGGVLAETAFDALGTAALVGPLPLYFAEVAAAPPLAVTLPAVAVALPEAHANMERVATALGEGVASECHDLFAEARRMSSRRNR